MARLLMLAIDIAQNGRQEGDPVGVFEDSHVFGEREDKRVWLANGNPAGAWPGTFYVIDVTGMPVAVARRIYDKWKRAAVPGEPEFDAQDQEDRFVILGRHRWQLGVADKLPGGARQALRRDGFLVFGYDIPTINGYMTDRSALDTFVPGVGGPIDPAPPPPL
jgi:hypothetical protein